MKRRPDVLFEDGYEFSVGNLDCAFRCSNGFWAVEVRDPNQPRPLFVTVAGPDRLVAYRSALDWCKAHVRQQQGRPPAIA